MIIRRGKGDLNVVYRPCRIDEVHGHETIKKMIANAIEHDKLPHALLFTGPSGCGKTSFARIIALGLNCEKGPTANPCCKCESCRSILNMNSMSVIELDAGRTGDVATVRQIINDLPAAPFNTRYKVAIFDEAHLLGGASRSEDALLKFLEDTPPHVYIIFCTNYPEKLKEVTRNRCKIIRFERLTINDVFNLLEEVSQFEGYNYNKEVLSYIAEESEGVPRAALSYLQQIAMEGSWTKKAASAIINAGIDIEEEEVINLCKMVLQGKFKAAINMVKKLKKVPIENLRMAICGYFVGCLKRSKHIDEAVKFSKIIDLFSIPYFNNPKPEHLLINSIFKACNIILNKEK